MAISPEIKNFSAEQNAEVVQYLESVFKPEDEILREIRERSTLKGLPQIAVGSFDGKLLQTLARAVGARKIVEIGTLGGYSAVCLARALPKDGMLHVFEMDERCARVAEESFSRAGLSEKVTLHLGAALDKLSAIEKDGPFDFVFVDADKDNYVNYLAWAKKNLRRGGMIAADNTLAWGMLADSEFESDREKKLVNALRRFNEAIASDTEFLATMVPTGEGLTIGVKL